MIARKQFPLLLSDDERQLFEAYAEMKGWTISKTIRITGRAFIQLAVNNLSAETALSKSITADVENKK